MFRRPSPFADHVPEVHSGVGSPGPPGFGTPFQVTRSVQAQRPQKAKVAGRESVGLLQGAHCNVLSGPLADAGNFTKPVEEVSGIDDALKTDSPIANRPRQRPDGFGPRTRQADTRKVGSGKSIGCGENMSDARCRGERLAESLH